MPAKTLRRLVRGGRRFEPTWRYVFNLHPTLSYHLSRSALQGDAARVLADLNRHGVAMTSVPALLGTDSCYGELCSRVEGLQTSMETEIEEAQAGADNPSTIGKKKFILEYLGRNPKFDPAGVYARFALEKNVLGVANAYLGMLSRLRYYNVWHTFPTQTEARESQLWHRDREDFLIVKVFLYLSDVDEGAGPFTYARGTHPKGNPRKEAAYSLEGNVKRSTDAQMAAVVPAERWFHGVGPKGTIIFADTRGYHRGGLARERARVMYTAMFTSPASESEEFMVDGPRFRFPLGREQAFAVGGRKA
jgi:hypothetical protein